jgi:steroid delta-isomerase-like uncharacterized protein
MSHLVADLIGRYYAAFNRGDFAVMLACLSEDVRHDINQGGTEIGKAAFATFLARMQKCYAEQLANVVILADADRASAEYTVSGQYLASDEGLPQAHGQRYEIPGGAFFSVQEGLITRVSNYYNLPLWLAQIGQTS